MTSEHKLKIIPLNEEEKAHEELERAINDVNKNKQKVFDLTVFLIGKIQDRFIKEGRTSEAELRKICREIWKRQPQHTRQIQRIFNWKDPVTGERPYRRFAGKHGEEDDAELYITTKSGLSYSKKKRETSYDTFQNRIVEDSFRSIEEKIELVSLEGPSLEDKKKLMYNLQDLAGKMEREIKSNEMKGFIPSNAGISYHGHSSKDDDTFPGIPERKREKITLQPADIPKDELTRIFQKHEAKLHYHSAKIHTKMGDKLIKMLLHAIFHRLY